MPAFICCWWRRRTPRNSKVGGGRRPIVGRSTIVHFTPVFAFDRSLLLGIRFSSSAHSPRSISWQRLLQNGRANYPKPRRCHRLGIYYGRHNGSLRLLSVLGRLSYTIQQQASSSQAFRHHAIFAIQRRETNGIAGLVAGNLRIKLRCQMEAQAQQICPSALSRKSRSG